MGTPQTRNVSTGTGASYRTVRLLTTASYIALLAGQFGFERAGLPNVLHVPERLLAALLLTIVVTSLNIATITRRSGYLSVPLPSIILPFIYLAITTYWAPDNTDLGPVLADLSSLVLYCVAFAALARWDIKAVQSTLMWCLTWTGLAFSIAGLAGAVIGSRVSAFGGGPIIYSRITFLGVISLVWLVNSGRMPSWTLTTVPLMLVATIASGSRGGMLAATIGLIVISDQLVRLTRTRLVAVVFLGAATIGAIFYYVGDVVTQTFQRRVIELTFGDGYTSGRGPLVGTGIDMFRESPFFGHGLRSFEAVYGRGYTYPHNLLVQMAAEGGVIGLLLLILPLATFGFVSLRAKGSMDSRSWAACALVIFTSSMFSGDYYDTRFMWIFILVGTAVANARRITRCRPCQSTRSEAHLDDCAGGHAAR